MSELALGVYAQNGLPDTIIPLAVDALGRLQTTATSTISSAVEINNDVGNPIPVSGPITDTQLRATPLTTEPLGIPATSRQLTATTASANTALTTTCRRISIKARNADMRFSIGAVAQTASATTSHFIELGERLDLAVPANANIAVIRDSLAVADGTLCITELS